MTDDPYAPDSPPIFYPFDPAIYPDPSELISVTGEWLASFGLAGDASYTRFPATGGAELSTHIWPDIPRNRLQDFSNYSAWGFLLDDMVENGVLGTRICDIACAVSALARIAEVPTAGLLGDDPLGAAFASVTLDFRRWATPTQMRRFADTFRQWMAGFIWEASVRERGTTLDLNTYISVLLGSGATGQALAMGEMGLGLELPARERDQRPVIAATEAALIAAELDNERSSHTKMERGDEHSTDIFNIILRENPRYTFSQALREGVAIRDRCLVLYLRLRDQLLRHASEELQTYFHVTDRIASGTVDFQTTCIRYLDADSPVADFPRSGKPSDSRTDPLPIPTIAWWWDQLEA